MPSIDLNCDLGESFGAYTIGNDEGVLPFITSANIACGYHAGDPAVMHRSVALCKRYGVQVGAHPGLPDLAGFGRRNMAISPADAADCVAYQIGALKAFCDEVGCRCTTSSPTALCTTWPPGTAPWPTPSAGRCRKRRRAPFCWRFRAARWWPPPKPSACRWPARYLPTAATAPTARWCPAGSPAP